MTLELLWKKYKYLKEIELLKSKVKQLEPSVASEQLLSEIELLLLKVEDADIQTHLQTTMGSNKKMNEMSNQNAANRIR
jgi:hypothetical protein